MKNLFQANTVASICSTLSKTVDRLEALRDRKLYDADVMDDVIMEAELEKAEALDEAKRAEKIANNVKKLLDIS